MRPELVSDLLLGRRRALKALAGAPAAAIGVGVLGAGVMSSAAAAKSTGSLDYDDPYDNLYAFGKIWAGYDEPVYGAYHGVMYARLTTEIPRFAFGAAADEPTVMNAGMNRTDADDGKIPFILPFENYGDDVLLGWDYAHGYQNPVTKDKWPKAHTGAYISPSEHFTFRMSKTELEDRSVPSSRLARLSGNDAALCITLPRTSITKLSIALFPAA